MQCWFGADKIPLLQQEEQCPPVFSISLCPVKAESPPQRGRNHLLYPILIMCVTWEVAVFEFVAVFLSNAHSLRLCPSPQASATTEMGFLGKKKCPVLWLRTLWFTPSGVAVPSPWTPNTLLPSLSFYLPLSYCSIYLFTRECIQSFCIFCCLKIRKIEHLRPLSLSQNNYNKWHSRSSIVYDISTCFPISVH